MLLERINAYVAEAKHILSTYSIHVKIDKVSMSAKMSSALGIASFKGNEENGYFYQIKISSKIFKEDSKNLRETVFHEVSHLADVQFTGNFDHGPTWVRMMNLLGLKGERYASEKKVAEIGYVKVKRVHKRYVVQCECCQKEHKMTSQKFRRLSNFRCLCKGRLHFTGKVV